MQGKGTARGAKAGCALGPGMACLRKLTTQLVPTQQLGDGQLQVLQPVSCKGACTRPQSVSY